MQSDCFCSLNLLFCGVLVAVAVLVAKTPYCIFPVPCIHYCISCLFYTEGTHNAESVLYDVFGVCPNQKAIVKTRKEYYIVYVVFTFMYFLVWVWVLIVQMRYSGLLFGSYGPTARLSNFVIHFLALLALPFVEKQPIKASLSFVSK